MRKEKKRERMQNKCHKFGIKIAKNGEKKGQKLKLVNLCEF